MPTAKRTPNALAFAFVLSFASAICSPSPAAAQTHAFDDANGKSAILVLPPTQLSTSTLSEEWPTAPVLVLQCGLQPYRRVDGSMTDIPAQNLVFMVPKRIGVRERTARSELLKAAATTWVDLHFSKGPSATLAAYVDEGEDLNNAAGWGWSDYGRHRWDIQLVFFAQLNIRRLIDSKGDIRIAWDAPNRNAKGQITKGYTKQSVSFDARVLRDPAVLGEGRFAMMRRLCG